MIIDEKWGRVHFCCEREPDPLSVPIKPLRQTCLPETLKRFEADYLSPAAVRKMLPVEMAKWGNVAKMANIRING